MAEGYYVTTHRGVTTTIPVSYITGDASKTQLNAQRSLHEMRVTINGSDAPAHTQPRLSLPDRAHEDLLCLGIDFEKFGEDIIAVGAAVMRGRTVLAAMKSTGWYPDHHAADAVENDAFWSVHKSVLEKLTGPKPGETGTRAVERMATDLIKFWSTWEQHANAIGAEFHVVSDNKYGDLKCAETLFKSIGLTGNAADPTYSKEFAANHYAATRSGDPPIFDVPSTIPHNFHVCDVREMCGVIKHFALRRPTCSNRARARDPIQAVCNAMGVTREHSLVPHDPMMDAMRTLVIYYMTRTAMDTL